MSDQTMKPLARIEEFSGVEMAHVGEQLNKQFDDTDYEFVSVMFGDYWIVEHGKSGWEVLGQIHEDQIGDIDPTVREWPEDYFAVAGLSAEYRYIVSEESDA